MHDRRSLHRWQLSIESQRRKSRQTNGAFKEFEDLGEAGATSLDAAAFSRIANWLAEL